MPTDYPSGRGELWWLALEEIVARADDEIELCRNGALWRLPTTTLQEKWRSFGEIYWWLRAIDERSYAVYDSLDGALRAVNDEVTFAAQRR